jgi:YHS domain-containing protein
MKAIDPVCAMEVDTETAQYVSEYQGETYYFCSPGCKRDFDSNPRQYIPGEDDPGGRTMGSGTHG